MQLDIDRYDSRLTANGSAAAIRKVRAEATRSADTHLLAVPALGERGVDIYLKDESTHTTGSLKHRLARSLFLYALANGWIRPGKPIVEASSGSTAVSEAYFARLIGNPFIAVLARTTAAEKVRLIQAQKGTCHFVDDPSSVYQTAAAIAADSGGHYMDQFTYAERATDWRQNNNIAESIFAQMALRGGSPSRSGSWRTAGTGGTSTTAGPLRPATPGAGRESQWPTPRIRHSWRAGASTTSRSPRRSAPVSKASGGSASRSRASSAPPSTG